MLSNVAESQDQELDLFSLFTLVSFSALVLFQSMFHNRLGRKILTLRSARLCSIDSDVLLGIVLSGWLGMAHMV